jgi:thiamine-monophosphate kinase
VNIKSRINETSLIKSFTRTAGAAGVKPRGLVVGVGDDAAVFRGEKGKDLVITQDIMVEGRHFERKWFTGYQLGWRLAAVNLSDVAAMGARPLYGLFSLVIPSDVDVSYVEAAQRGIVAHLARYGAALIGGNISGAQRGLTCDLTLIGSCDRGKAWRRNARAGDVILIAGRLGEAAAGLEILRSAKTNKPGGRLVDAYKKPLPMLDAADVLKTRPEVRGAIDVSDGLSTDLLHVCRAAGLGCEIEAALLPLSASLLRFCRDHKKDPLEWMLNGGEDYALVLAVSPRYAARVVAVLKQKLTVPVTAVGRFTKQRSCYWRDLRNKRRRLKPGGWDHLGQP